MKYPSHALVGIIFLLLTGCATSPLDYFGGGPPDDPEFSPTSRCSSAITYLGDTPIDGPWAVDRACQRFSEEFSIPIEAVAAVLADLEIYFVRNAQFEQCAERGRSCTSRTRAEINMASLYWRAIIMHEVTHVLLLYFEPDLPHHQHHSFMLSRGICFRGCHPASLLEIAAGYH